MTFRSPLSPSTLLWRVHCFRYATLPRVDCLSVSGQFFCFHPQLCPRSARVTDVNCHIQLVCSGCLCLYGKCFYLQTRLAGLLHISCLALCLFRGNIEKHQITRAMLSNSSTCVRKVQQFCCFISFL